MSSCHQAGRRLSSPFSVLTPVCYFFIPKAFAMPANSTDTNVDADHTYLMFSATFSKEARKLASETMEEDFVRIKVGRIGSTHSNIKQNILFVRKPSCEFGLCLLTPCAGGRALEEPGSLRPPLLHASSAHHHLRECKGQV